MIGGGALDTRPLLSYYVIIHLPLQRTDVTTKKDTSRIACSGYRKEIDESLNEIFSDNLIGSFLQPYRSSHDIETLITKSLSTKYKHAEIPWLLP